MPQKQKVRNAVLRKLKQDVVARIPKDGKGDRSAYRAVGEGENEGDEDPYYYADTPGGRDGATDGTSARRYGGAVPGLRGDDAAGRGEDDLVVMDASLAAPSQLGAFERVIADPSLAGVDFEMDEAATPPARTKDWSGAARSPALHVNGGRSGRGRESGDKLRQSGHARGDDGFQVHEPAERQWNGLDAGAEGDGEADADTSFYEHSDGIELLKMRSDSTGASSRGDNHGLSGGKITSSRAFIHILKSYIGSGVLGLPYAYAQGGMLAAMTGMGVVSIMSTICVFLLLDCKKKLTGRVRTFGDVGYGALGRTGHILVELTVVLSQLGFSCAYLIFVSQNLFLYVKLVLTTEASIVWMLVPLLVGLSWIPSLDVLAPFSVLSLLLIFSGLGAVAWHAAPRVGSGPDVQSYIPSTLPIFIGMAIYAFEGIGLALPIQNQMLHPESFKMVWASGMIVVTCTYIGFGAFCYSCYGDEVPSIITMVLPNDATSLLVKLGLSIALILTYPIAMFPVFEIIEDSWAPWLFVLRPAVVGATSEEQDKKDAATSRAIVWKRRGLRFLLVLLTATAAVLIPDFSIVMAFIGSVPSNLMAFFLPALFHLVICWRVMGFWARMRDVLLLLSAMAAVVICTWTTVFGLINHLEIP